MYPVTDPASAAPHAERVTPACNFVGGMPGHRRCAPSSDFKVLRCDPPSGASGPPWPTIMFLHGIGQVGDGSLAALCEIAQGGGLPREIEQQENTLLHDPSCFPFLVVPPQTPSRWEHVLEDVETVLTRLMQSGLVRRRPLLTGFSLGGDGVWTVAARHPSMFAAIAPIASADPPQAQLIARNLANVPIWIAYRRDDEHASRSRPSAVIEALAQAGNADVEIREYVEAPPPKWSRHAYLAHQAYTDPQLYRWLLERAA
jgi:predicted peptidase